MGFNLFNTIGILVTTIALSLSFYLVTAHYIDNDSFYVLYGLIMFIILGCFYPLKKAFGHDVNKGGKDLSKQIIKRTDIIMFIIYLILYIIVVTYFRNMLIAFPLSSILFNLFAICGLLLIIFYNPLKNKYDDNIASALKSYLNFKKDDSSNPFSDQLKSSLVSALNGKNKYFVLGFMIFLYIPFFLYLIYLINTQLPSLPNIITAMGSVLYGIVPVGILVLSIVRMVTNGFNIWWLIACIVSFLFVLQYVMRFPTFANI
jgi:hypothetical protein